LSYGADSNGSGAALLLLLAKVLSKVYAEKNRPKYNVMFILSGGGKLNYLGSKNWIEQQMEKSSTLQVNKYLVYLKHKQFLIVPSQTINVSGCVICSMFRFFGQ